MTKRTLESIKAAFGEKNNNRENFSNRYYPFYNMKAGERCVVRFLPDLNEENPRGFLIESKYHDLVINGERKRVPSLTMWGEDCPISKVAADYYNAGDKENGKRYYRKINYIGQVLVVEDPLPADKETGTNFEGQVKLISLGFQIYNIIKDAFTSDELETIPYGIGSESDDEDSWGYDFIIKKTQQGEYATYTVGTKFANRPRGLTDEEVAAVEEARIDLTTTLPTKPTLEKVKAMLNADINGDQYDDDDGDQDTDDSAEEVVAPSKSKQVAKTPKAKAAEDEPGVEDMLAAIRNRRKATAAE